MNGRAKDRFAVIGQPLPKIDAWAKVTGETRYADDLVLPRMAYAKLLRSTHAHARLVRIDAEREQRFLWHGFKSLAGHGPRKHLRVPFRSITVTNDIGIAHATQFLQIST